MEDLLAEFNLFNVLGVARSEIHHSRVIAWLLNPRESHGLGDYFLRGFLSQASASAKEREIKCVAFTPADVEGWKFGNIKVAPERHNIDILLIDERDGFVCPIENKVGSDEHSDQLSRYLQIVEREYKGLRPFPIYLTPDGRKPSKRRDAERWIPFGYEVVADLLKQTLYQCGLTISADVSSFLEQYERTIRRRVLDTPSDIDRLALQIYNKHRKAIDRIFKVRSNLGKMIFDIIESAVNHYALDLKRASRTGKLLKYNSHSLEDISDFHIEDKSERLILFDFLNHEDSMRLRLMVGRGNQETRERLYQIQPPTDYDYQNARRGPQNPEFPMYWRELLTQQECNTFDSEKMKSTVECRIQKFYENDYWPLVNAIREEFGLPPVSPN